MFILVEHLNFQLNKNGLLITLVIKKKIIIIIMEGTDKKIFQFSLIVEDIFSHNCHLIFILVSSLGSAHWPDYIGANIPADWYHIRYNCISNNRQGSYTKVS